MGAKVNQYVFVTVFIVAVSTLFRGNFSYPNNADPVALKKFESPINFRIANSYQLLTETILDNYCPYTDFCGGWILNLAGKSVRKR